MRDIEAGVIAIVPPSLPPLAFPPGKLAAATTPSHPERVSLQGFLENVALLTAIPEEMTYSGTRP